MGNGGILFDLNILPMNLINNRNLGELPGLQVFSAPKKCDKSRQNDVLIVLISSGNLHQYDQELAVWGKIISNGYFSARGSFTMGINAAVKKIGDYLQKTCPGMVLPNVVINMIVMRDRTLMIGHTGPANTTIVYADHIDNFSNELSIGFGQGEQNVRFYQAEIHSGDLILMCPYIPKGWTNEAILDATSESPLNVVRYLLDQAHGNLQGAVIQVKAGHGEILYRYKPPISTNIALGFENDPERKPEILEKQSTDTKKTANLLSSEKAVSLIDKPGVLMGNDQESERPLYRLRVPFESLPDFNPLENITRGNQLHEEYVTKSDEESNGTTEKFVQEGTDNLKVPDEKSSSSDAQKAEELGTFSDAGSTEAENSVDSRHDPSDPAIPDQRTLSARERIARKKLSLNDNALNEKTIKKKNTKNLILLLVFGFLIPICTALIFFFIYSGRGKNEIYRESLGLAVDTAKVAVQQADPVLRRISWEKVLEYLDEADQYGSSKASTDLRYQSYAELESIEKGKQTIYHYALSNQLPNGTNLIRIESTPQYVYALDQTTGSILRFFIYSNGLTLDNSFQCKPGTYPIYKKPGSESSPLDQTDSQATEQELVVKNLIDFVILPTGEFGNITLAAIDGEANLLYCAAEGKNSAVHLETPPIGWLGLDGLFFASKTLFVLDARNEAIWKFDFLDDDGFSTEPKSYFGAGAPSMRDVVDFVVYGDYSYLLRSNGTLIFCDYTGYDPACSYIFELKNAEGQLIDLTKKHMIQIRMNASPDTSLYLMDEKRQSVINMTLKLNLIRYIVPDRFAGEGGGKIVTGFGLLNTSNIVWASGSDLYIGQMP